ncbi:MAG: hypothetical protein NVSMB9_31800 [Isosphaeraceae bacterium]
MKVAVDFQDEQLEIDIPEDQLVLSWRGPRDFSAEEIPQRIAEAFENPRSYPPLHQVVVPGDRVVLALGSHTPETRLVIEEVCLVLERGGVERSSITVLTTNAPPLDFQVALPAGVVHATHDPDNREELAYLATTISGRRVYLNRMLTDADVVVPIASLGYEAVIGYQGPWSAIYPALSDTETNRSFRAGSQTTDNSHDGPTALHPLLLESIEVSELLGSHFQIGLLPGVTGLQGVVAGLGKAVLEEGLRLVNDAWEVRPGSRAELVIAGIGRPGLPTGIPDIARGLATATQMVQRGGKIVILSRAGGPIGPALGRLMQTDDPRNPLSTLRGCESEEDYPFARLIAQAIAWADIYLLSALDGYLVEELSMIPLERPEEAGRLTKLCGSCLLVSHADRAKARRTD